LRRSTKFLIPILLELLILGGLFGISLLIPSGSPSSCSTSSASANSTVNFTIIESDTGPYEGMNGSAYKSVDVNWPVIHVQRCQTVVIHVENVNSSEPHGFAIDHYFSTPNGASPYPGIELYSGQTFTVKFVADESGSFRMYCSVFCAIHPEMQNGLLVVS
jgi:FtsP/CotA-like multicopper oxidase with cupredoxin domain